jgi:centromere/kinetochore protein ZW10
MLTHVIIGVGIPQRAEHTERRMVGRDEGRQIASTGNMVTQEWDAAWESEEEEPLPPGTNKASLEEQRRVSEVPSAVAEAISTPDPMPEDDDGADAWGWGDEDAMDEPLSENVVEPPPPPPDQPPVDRHITPETREVTLSEPYQISSMPEPVFKTISGIFNDGAKLASPEYVLFCLL